MKSEREIQERLASTNDAFVIETLRWVLDSDCMMCAHPKKREFELALHNQEYGAGYLEVKYNWPEGTVMNHMDNHINYDYGNTARWWHYYNHDYHRNRRAANYGTGGDGQATVLNLNEGAFHDLSVNDVVQTYGIPITEFPDTSPPGVDSAVFNFGTSILTITSNETLSTRAENQNFGSCLGRIWEGLGRSGPCNII